MRTVSLAGVLDLGLRHALITKMPAQVFGRAEINFPAADKTGKLFLHVEKMEESRYMAGLEFDQRVDVAFWTKVLAQDRAE